ncbi:hypothetical protein HELRODRAFT_105598 [Helobdella robusta]|uniref:Pecanex-like protein n=1 Tax=Helobdella robusta TaxID=6412 RepID=T1EDW5_HELRO|nr:hypothetical protein HELRODRAFT_105598 [Helobdella robusta]ESO12875.1 hypothetical protein HELRODRAFT_105598 [Helobdella robusta]
MGLFRDFEVLLCFVVASSQYSLIKSVQPDAASPMHGHNHIIAFSRPIYFVLCSTSLIILHSLSSLSPSFINQHHHHVLHRRHDEYSADLTICLPLIFVFGLLPQINTFLLYIFEQVEIHIFGGTALTSLTGAFFSMTRNIICLSILYAFCLGSLWVSWLPNTVQHLLFSIFCGVLVSIAYHLSRYTNNPIVMLLVGSDGGSSSGVGGSGGSDKSASTDPLTQQLEKSVSDRLYSDIITCLFTAIIVFAVTKSTAFTSPALQPFLLDLLIYTTSVIGFILHYILPQLRLETPWMCLSHPILKSPERNLFEVKGPSRVMPYEKFYLWMCFVERNIFLPATLLNALNISVCSMVDAGGDSGGAGVNIFLVISVCGLKMFRSSFNHASSQFYTIFITKLLFSYDYAHYSRTFLVDYFVVSILLYKIRELMMKLKFIMTYIAPWQITWGSAFHAFAQPFSIPHSGLMFLQTLLSSITSSPVSPFFGSTIFLISYPRPIKFWEKDYNTKRLDNTNTRLALQIDAAGVKSDDDNLNSIFYEHLTRSLQRSLAGDVALGRWGEVRQGDCYVMASDYLNALVHVVEKGNGFLTFQLRGLEFRGTYCQQREVEAISEDVGSNAGFCCCKPGHLPHFLSVNASFGQRWLAWQVIAGMYVLEGYSVSDNSAATMLHAFDFKKMFITYYVKCIIYYTIRSPKLDSWLTNESLQQTLTQFSSPSYVDVDPIFTSTIDIDYDFRLQGVSRGSFVGAYSDWIKYCAQRRDENMDTTCDSFLATLCYTLSLLCRRSLYVDAHHNSSINDIQFFLYGLYNLFKGDIRINSLKDEWVFMDMQLLKRVVAPAVRMALKLHQDHFISPEEYVRNQSLYDSIASYENDMVISHEGDPAWRNAVLSNVQSLLSLRHVMDEGNNEYKIIMLTKKYLNFRVIKVNSECVRSFWSGQLQELIFLRNNNSERGSIQNAKQSLRNIINSSCDQPIGYPIYVSPLTTSYLGTNPQYVSVAGKEMDWWAMFSLFRRFWSRLKTRCNSSCASGRSIMAVDDPTTSCRNLSINNNNNNINNNNNNNNLINVNNSGNNNNSININNNTNNINNNSNNNNSVNNGSSSAVPLRNKRSQLNGGSLVSTDSSGKPNLALSSLVGLVNDQQKQQQSQQQQTQQQMSQQPQPPQQQLQLQQQQQQPLQQQQQPQPQMKEVITQRVQIIDPSKMFDNINLGRPIDVQWPFETWRKLGGRNAWGGWTPEAGVEGILVHRWTPCHRDPVKRSNTDKTILLVKVLDKYVPMAEGGVVYQTSGSGGYGSSGFGGVE